MELAELPLEGGALDGGGLAQRRQLRRRRAVELVGIAPALNGSFVRALELRGACAPRRERDLVVADETAALVDAAAELRRPLARRVERHRVALEPTLDPLHLARRSLRLLAVVAVTVVVGAAFTPRLCRRRRPLLRRAELVLAAADRNVELLDADLCALNLLRDPKHLLLERRRLLRRLVALALARRQHLDLPLQLRELACERVALHLLLVHCVPRAHERERRLHLR